MTTGVRDDLVLVDDDELMLERVFRHLRRTNWSARYFSDPEEALTCLLHGDVPELLIVDSRMPRMDGLNLLEQLLGIRTLPNSRIFLCSSAHPPAEVCARAEKCGIRILSKDELQDKSRLMALLDSPQDHY